MTFRRLEKELGHSTRYRRKLREIHSDRNGRQHGEDGQTIATETVSGRGEVPYHVTSLNLAGLKDWLQ